MRQLKVVVAGAGGFIGHHLVKRLKAEGHFVRGVDIKMPEFEKTAADEFLQLDLRDQHNARVTCLGMDDVYQLAADMGGIGYITQHHFEIAKNNTRININMTQAAIENRVQRYLYTSSACVYPQGKQLSDFKQLCALKEDDAYPAQPEPGYGWEKLYAEELVRYAIKDYGLNARIVRFHNVYGELGTYKGGREKSPAAICRKVATAILEGRSAIDVWGDGQQVRSYMYISDCVEGLRRIMDSGYMMPLNLGTEEALTIDEQAEITMAIAGRKLELVHDKTKPQGVRGRNSDNTLLRTMIGWQPSISFEQGLVPTYNWINEQVKQNYF